MNQLIVVHNLDWQESEDGVDGLKGDVDEEAFPIGVLSAQMIHSTLWIVHEPLETRHVVTIPNLLLRHNFHFQKIKHLPEYVKGERIEGRLYETDRAIG